MAAWVELSDAERRAAWELARTRQREAERLGMRDRHGVDPSNGLHVHYVGALGELGVAKYLAHEQPSSVNTLKAPDLPGHVQVRTRTRMSYDLIVRDDDASDDLFVLAVAWVPWVIVRGGMLGLNAMQPKWRRAVGGRPPAFFVPADALLSPELVRSVFARAA